MAEKPDKNFCFSGFCFDCILFGLFFSEAASLKTKAPELKAKKKETRVVLSWSKNKNLIGYQVFSCNQKGSSRKLLKTTRGSSYTIKNLKRGKTYYYRLRGYKKKGKKTYYTSLWQGCYCKNRQGKNYGKAKIYH